MKTRRDALRTLAAGALVPVVRAQHQHAGEPLVQLTKPQAPKNLNAADFQLLSQLVDLIIPRSDTPGASDAGVPIFIDRRMGLKAATSAAVLDGLGQMRAAGFAGLDEPARIAYLKNMEAQSNPFFKFIKDLTIDGYYSSKEGLVQELGYHGNTYLREFPGCTHPEHGGGPDAN